MDLQLIITAAFIACGLFTFLRLVGRARETAMAKGACRPRADVCPAQPKPITGDIPEVMGYDVD